MLAAEEFIRRFLIHVLLKAFHCIRHYGSLPATYVRAGIPATMRALIAVTLAAALTGPVVAIFHLTASL